MPDEFMDALKELYAEYCEVKLRMNDIPSTISKIIRQKLADNLVGPFNDIGQLMMGIYTYVRQDGTWIVQLSVDTSVDLSEIELENWKRNIIHALGISANVVKLTITETIGENTATFHELTGITQKTYHNKLISYNIEINYTAYFEDNLWWE